MSTSAYEQAGTALSVDSLIEGHRLIVCVGPGGVGKTSVAATLALQAAKRGKKALVLTIDPARRLASALGLDGLDDEIREVPTEPLERWGVRVEGSLHAAMLETRASYDSLIQRLSGEQRGAERILSNRVYRAFSRTLARSHAYVAMERLYEAMEGGFDLVVLDTPPTRSALDILDAPGRLARFLDDEVVRWFLKPVLGSGPLSRLIPTGGAAAGRLLSLLASRQLVEELTTFFNVLLHLREGFQKRAETVQQLLRASDTAFCLVCSPSLTSLWDAAYLRDSLVSREVPLHTVIYNRSYIPRATSLSEPVKWAPASEPGQRLSQLELSNRRVGEAMLLLMQELGSLRQEVAAWNHTARAAVSRFSERLPAGCNTVLLPELNDDPRDLIDLAQLAKVLFEPQPAPREPDEA